MGPRVERLLLVKRSGKQLGLPQNWQSNSSLPTTGYDNEIAVLSLSNLDGDLQTLYKPEGGKFVGDVDLHDVLVVELAVEFVQAAHGCRIHRRRL